jgi:hypothetical protein
MHYCFAVKRVVPVWREDPTLPEGGYLDRFHTVRVTAEEWKRLQDDGFAARTVQGDETSPHVDEAESSPVSDGPFGI